MKDKKKFLNRVVTSMCALMVVVSIMGASANFYASVSAYYPDGFPKDSLSFEIPSGAYSYKYIACFIYYDSDTGNEMYRNVFCSDSPFSLSYRKHGSLGYLVQMNFDRLYYANYGSEDWRVSNSGITDVCHVGSDGIFLYSLLYSNSPIYDSDGSIFADAYDVGGDSIYNSSLGYLQNIQRKNLTLDGESYDPDYDSWQVMFTFDSKTTTGLDITSGGYSVRHFMNWEVRDKDSNIIRTYDKVSCGEYDATSCKISYPLYSTRQDAMSACEFVPLSWWESGVLGYKVYIYDYLQLVRTNADGSVEYGGYVRIDDNGYVADTLDDNFTEDPNGYLDQDVSSSNGSGSNYEDAEHDADKNANSSSESSESLLSQINLLTSVIKAVPELIMEVFRFLPEWCLDLVATAFAFSIIITIYKLGN